MKGISIIICCYNSAGRIAPTLEHIAKQQYHGFPIEVLLIDNASTDGTATTATAIWQNLDQPRDLHFQTIQEPRPGLSYARTTGMENATFDRLLFCDDDNHLKADYCQLAYDAFEQIPNLGIVGGQGFGKYTSTPPPWFIPFEHYFAIGEQAKDAGDITAKEGYVWGAGMVIHSDVYKQLQKADYNSLLSDRKGTALTSGGDVELCQAARLLGYKIYYLSSLQYDHEIPIARVDWKKVRKMSYAVGTSSALLLAYEIVFREHNGILQEERRQWTYYVRKHLKWLNNRKNLVLKTLFQPRQGNQIELDILYFLGFTIHLLKHNKSLNDNVKRLRKLTTFSNNKSKDLNLRKTI